MLISNELPTNWPARILTTYVSSARVAAPHSHFERVRRGVADVHYHSRRASGGLAYCHSRRNRVGRGVPLQHSHFTLQAAEWLIGNFTWCQP